MPDFNATAPEVIYYGPHQCARCAKTIVKAAREQGGHEYDYPLSPEPIYPNTPWREHVCSPDAVPRRIDTLRWTPAERAIHDAVQAVERAGAHVLLTDAVILLGRAQRKVADFVDGVEDDGRGRP